MVTAVNPADTIGKVFTGGLSQLGSLKWIFIAFIIIAVIAVLIFILSSIKKTKERWNIQIRVRMEDTQKGEIYLDPITVRGRRVTLSNGLRLIYLEKEILGKKLFPLLNWHTKPGVYDLVVTADNRIFIINGIAGIDEERKLLKVGIRYPGIDYSLEEVNRDHAALNKLDRKSDLLGIIKAASMAVIAVVLLVGFIVGGKYWIEGREIDKAIAQSELLLFETLQQTTIAQEEQTNGMILLTEKLKELLGTTNLRKSLAEASG